MSVLIVPGVSGVWGVWGDEDVWGEEWQDRVRSKLDKQGLSSLDLICNKSHNIIFM